MSKFKHFKTVISVEMSLIFLSFSSVTRMDQRDGHGQRRGSFRIVFATSPNGTRCRHWSRAADDLGIQNLVWKERYWRVGHHFVVRHPSGHVSATAPHCHVQGRPSLVRSQRQVELQPHPLASPPEKLARKATQSLGNRIERVRRESNPKTKVSARLFLAGVLVTDMCVVRTFRYQQCLVAILKAFLESLGYLPNTSKLKILDLRGIDLTDMDFLKHYKGLFLDSRVIKTNCQIYLDLNITYSNHYLLWNEILPRVQGVVKIARLSTIFRTGFDSTKLILDALDEHVRKWLVNSSSSSSHSSLSGTDFIGSQAFGDDQWGISPTGWFVESFAKSEWTRPVLRHLETGLGQTRRWAKLGGSWVWKKNAFSRLKWIHICPVGRGWNDHDPGLVAQTEEA